MDDRRQHWEASYRARQNYLFYPSEEVIRFIAGHVRKRVSLAAYVDCHGFGRVPRLLDLGCGIGRHVVYAHEVGLDAYGLDLSTEAVAMARTWALLRGLDRVEDRIRQGHADHLDWEDGFFDVVISCGTLDSMPYPTAQASCAAVHRVLTNRGLFYCDLISGNDSDHGEGFVGEELVATEHERGTVQSYFNLERIEELLQGRFHMIQCKLIRQEDVLGGTFHSRYHLVARKQ